jgi:hypothetical protein
MSDDMLNFARNNPRVMAQVLLSLVALASPLHSVWLTLSRATLNAYALVLVLTIVVISCRTSFASNRRSAVRPRPTCASPRRRALRTRGRPTRATRHTQPPTRNSRATCSALRH